MKKKYLLLAIVAASLANNAWADGTGSFDAGVKLGTLGFGVEVNYPLNSYLTVAVGLNKFSKSRTDTIDNNDYKENIDLKTLSLLLNFHPFAGSFRLTAGAMINNNELSLKAEPNATYDINGTLYSAAQVGKLEANVDFHKFAPYAGIGFGHSASSGLGFTLDLGVMMQGKPNVDLSSTGGVLSNDATFQSELKKEEANAEDDIKDFTVYPVVSVGLNYRF